MAKTNIGRVSVVPKDEYSSTENYKRLDVVSSDGSMYISKKDNNIGNPLSDENWWFKAVEKGEVGAQGEKPINGVDYNTPEEKEEFKNDVVSKATEEVEKNIADIEAEAIENYNNNADAKTEEYDTNANSKLTAYNDNATQKTEEYNSNATSKVSKYNTNASTQIETFNNNATNKTNTFDENATIKTNAFNDIYDEKMQAINEASTSIEAERKISDSKYACALKTQVKDAQQAQIYAENDLVNDLVVNGVELTQETREGYNLLSTENLQELNENGITLTKENGVITLNGKSTATSFIDAYIVGSSSNYEEFLSAGTYLISGITGEALSPNFGILVVIKHLDESTTTIIQNSENKSFTVREGDTFRIFIRIPQNLQLSNVVIKPMIVAGEENKDFEQYGASPSLDFPSEIQVASEQNISIYRKNILDTNNINKTVSGITFISKEDGGININGNPTSTFSTIKPIDLNVPIKAGTKLFMNYGKTVNLNRDNTFSVFVWLYDKKGNLFKTINRNDKSAYVVSKDIYKLNFGFESFTTGNTYNEDIYIELEISDEQPTQFQKYEATDITIPLVNSAIGQYTDTIDREKNVQNKVIEKVSFNSNLDWTYNQPENKFMCSIPAGVKVKDISLPQLCTHYKIKGDFASNENEFACTANGFRFHNDNNMTLEEWKTFLEQQNQAGTPLTVYYIAETSTQEPLSEEVKQELDKFKLYDNLNNVFIDKGSLSFKYNKSLLRAFEEQSELSASLLDRIQALEAAQVNSVGGN